MTDAGSKCLGHGRHWFTVYGAPGLRSPRCQRCGVPNPRPLTTDERLNYEDYMRASERHTREG